MKKIKKRMLYVLVFCLFITVLWGIKIVVIHEVKKGALPVLGYHSVVKDDIKEQYYKHDLYVMGESEFKKQMQYLYDHQYRTLTMEETYAYYQGTFKVDQKSVVLTFDDGYKNVIDIVEPILKEYGFHATCFVIGEKLTSFKHRIGNEYLQAHDLENNEYIAFYSHSFGLHHLESGVDRKRIDVISKDKLQEDIDKSKEVVDTKYFAYPYGRSTKISREVLMENDVLLAFGYNQNRNMTMDDDQYLLPRYSMFSQMPFWYFTWIVE